MTALAGVWKFGGADGLSSACGEMLGAQRAYARRPGSVLALSDAAIGCALFGLLPEDRFDAQPYLDESGGWSLVADARLDNRIELLDALQLPRQSEISDSELLFRAYSRWGNRACAKIEGDFAFAVWNARDRSLTMARDATGQRPLHFHLGKGFAAFASMPEGLHALPEIERAIDRHQLAMFVADIPRVGPGTYFEGVRRVEPGQLVKITPGGSTATSYWQMPARELRFEKDEDYIHAFREQLERATVARLRGSGDAVAAHLSGGLDSNAVAATAAKAAPGTRVVAITSAPRPGFSGPMPVGRIGDESGLAGETAAIYPNMEHLVLRSAGRPLLESIESQAASFAEPVGHPCNNSWWSATNEAASARDLSVVLTGEAGNLTISAGGISLLADYIGAGRWADWRREAKAGVASAGWRWRGVMAASFAPWLPSPLFALLRSTASARSENPDGLSLLAPEWQAELGAVARKSARGMQIESGRKLRWELLRSTDPGSFRKGALGRWGIEERDPTADRRLADFCFSLPPDCFLKDGVSRRLARAALADRVPRSVIEGPRGYQFADWYETIDAAGLAAEIDRLERTLSGGVIDFDRLRRLAATWPRQGWDSLTVIVTYRILLLRAFAAAAFAASLRQ
jgi:asparagine synthase (glutamine-hydrolysing)